MVSDQLSVEMLEANGLVGMQWLIRWTSGMQWVIRWTRGNAVADQMD